MSKKSSCLCVQAKQVAAEIPSYNLNRIDYSQLLFCLFITICIVSAKKNVYDFNASVCFLFCFFFLCPADIAGVLTDWILWNNKLFPFSILPVRLVTTNGLKVLIFQF